jgi:hypothetical protein
MLRRDESHARHKSLGQLSPTLLKPITPPAHMRGKFWLLFWVGEPQAIAISAEPFADLIKVSNCAQIRDGTWHCADQPHR